MSSAIHIDAISKKPCFKCKATGATLLEKGFLFNKHIFISAFVAFCFHIRNILSSQEKKEGDRDKKIAKLISDFSDLSAIPVENLIDEEVASLRSLYTHALSDYASQGYINNHEAWNHFFPLSGDNSHYFTVAEYQAIEKHTSPKKSESKSKSKEQIKKFAYQFENGEIKTHLVFQGQTAAAVLPSGIEFVDILEESYKTNKNQEVWLFVDRASGHTSKDQSSELKEQVEHFFSLDEEALSYFEGASAAYLLADHEIGRLPTVEKKDRQQGEQLEFEMEVAADRELKVDEPATDDKAAKKRKRLSDEEKAQRQQEKEAAKAEKAKKKEEEKQKKKEEKEAQKAEKARQKKLKKRDEQAKLRLLAQQAALPAAEEEEGELSGDEAPAQKKSKQA